MQNPNLDNLDKFQVTVFWYHIEH